MPWTPEAAMKLLNNGVAIGITALVVWGMGLGIWFLYLLGKKTLNPAPPGFRPCDGCVFADDFRSPNELVGHRIFGFVRLARTSLIPNLPIQDVGRRALFTDLLDARFRLVSELHLLWLKTHLPTLNDMRADTLASEQLALIGDIAEAFESEARKLGVPAVVLERLRYWEGPRIGHLRSEIQLVCESEWLADSSQRLGFILSVLEQVLKATVLDAERTLAGLNGQLNGIVYRGYLIGPGLPVHGDRKAALDSSGPHTLSGLQQEDQSDNGRR